MTFGHDVDRKNIEQGVLGSMVLDAEAAEFALGALRGNEFAIPEHILMFSAIQQLIESNTEIHAVSLGDYLASQGQLASAGGALGIMEILEAAPHSKHVEYYTNKLQAMHHRDLLRIAGENLRVLAEDPTSDTSEMITDTIDELERIRAGRVQESWFKTAKEALADFDLKASCPSTVIDTGISDLDRKLINGGFIAGQLVIVAACTSFGKSSLMNQIVFHSATERRPGLIASLEMGVQEITARALKTTSRSDFVRLPVHFSMSYEFRKLQASLRLAKRRHKIEIAAIDYLQLIESPRDRTMLRHEQIAQVTRGLKRLAEELQIVILLGSQLNRDADGKDCPELKDLRESGSIEQDADIVIFIAGNKETDFRTLAIAKQRGGALAKTDVRFDRAQFSFRDLSEHEFSFASDRH